MYTKAPHINSMMYVEIFNPSLVKMDYVYLLQPIQFQLMYPCIVADDMPVISLVEFVSIHQCDPDIDSLLKSERPVPALRVYGCKMDNDGYLHDLDSHEKILLNEQVSQLMNQTSMKFVYNIEE